MKIGLFMAVGTISGMIVVALALLGTVSIDFKEGHFDSLDVDFDIGEVYPYDNVDMKKTAKLGMNFDKNITFGLNNLTDSEEDIITENFEEFEVLVFVNETESNLWLDNHTTYLNEGEHSITIWVKGETGWISENNSVDFDVVAYPAIE